MSADARAIRAVLDSEEKKMGITYSHVAIWYVDSVIASHLKALKTGAVGWLKFRKDGTLNRRGNVARLMDDLYPLVYGGEKLTLDVLNKWENVPEAMK